MRAIERFGETIFLKDGRLRPTLRVLVFVVATLLAFGLLVQAVIVFSSYFTRGGPTAVEQMLSRQEAASEGIAAVVIVGIALLLRHVLDRRSGASLGLAPRAGWLRLFGIGALLGAGMQGLVFAMESAAGCSHVSAIASLNSDVGELARFVPFFVAVAIAEEMSVRGYIFQNLWEDFGAPWAALISAAIFAALHLGNPNSHANLWLTVGGLAAFGLWACLSVVWTRSLWLAVGVHFAWNLFEGPVLGFPVSGLDFGSTAITQSISGPAWFTGGPFGPESGASSLLALAAGLAVLYWLHKRNAFSWAYDAREAYAQDKNAER